MNEMLFMLEQNVLYIGVVVVDSHLRRFLVEEFLFTTSKERAFCARRFDREKIDSDGRGDKKIT